MEFANLPHLLIVAPNWLGDAVMALPAIADVARALGRSRIVVSARPPIAPLFSMVPFVHEVTGAYRRGYDAVLLLPNSFRAALTAWRTGIPERWGFRTDCRGPLLTRGVPSPAAEHLHQAAYYQHLASALGFPTGPLEPRLEPTSEGRASGAALLHADGWDGTSPLVAIAPGAAYGGAKRWPAHSYAALASSLSRDGATVVIVGGPGDAAAARDVIARVDRAGRLLNLTGRTDLPALAGVLVRCRALVSNDSGAMHLGAALGVPVTALFGPTDERATRPLGRSDAPEPSVLTHDVWCRPCLLRECPLTHRCLKGIGTSEVAARIRLG
jgi:heptosyltransferase-2